MLRSIVIFPLSIYTSIYTSRRNSFILFFSSFFFITRNSEKHIAWSFKDCREHRRESAIELFRKFTCMLLITYLLLGISFEGISVFFTIFIFFLKKKYFSFEKNAFFNTLVLLLFSIFFIALFFNI